MKQKYDRSFHSCFENDHETRIYRVIQRGITQGNAKRAGGKTQKEIYEARNREYTRAFKRRRYTSLIVLGGEKTCEVKKRDNVALIG